MNSLCHIPNRQKCSNTDQKFRPNLSLNANSKSAGLHCLMTKKTEPVVELN